MKKSKLFLTLGFTLLLSLVLVACGGGSDSSSDSKSSSKDSGKPSGEQVLNLAESALIPSADSSKADDQVGLNVLNQTNEGLYALDKDGIPAIAGAAEEPKISDDKTVYTFKLREDAKWSNGDPVTANDYVFAWRRAVDPATTATYSYLFDAIKNGSEIVAGEKKPEELGVKAVDDYTLEVTLAKPTTYINSLFAFPTFFPLNEKYVTEKGDKYAQDSDSILYNGPFVLEDWTGTNKKWTYKKNDNYWDKKNVTLKQINVQVVQDSGTSLNLYNTGKIDRALLSAEYAAQNKDNKDYTVVNDSSTFYIKFNQKRDGKATPLANENIRRALALSIDKQAYVDTVLQNGSTPANNLVPPEFTFDPGNKEDYVKESGAHLEYNKKEAQKYWKKGLEELGVDKLELEFTSDDTENAKKSSEFLQNQWQTNLEGLSVSLKSVPFKVRLQNDQDQNYDMSMSGWGPDYQDPSTFLDLFKTDGSQNRMSYSNKDYDQILEDASVTYAADDQKRWDEMVGAEKILLDDDVAIQPLYHRANAYLQQSYIHNLQKNPFGPDYTYKNVYLTK
ncbi:peptide ABC transporter substrate-binding protein [Listeria costaricensis]|uniref:peptide ABC transporter substrate-binding protein n=1 Tax=Listeria costaricensis TaxID=2026604 RepID=UPI000C08CF22|nr:peptide ABC transporter substrate-binding protein [Listeria costaricensis]